MNETKDNLQIASPEKPRPTVNIYPLPKRLKRYRVTADSYGGDGKWLR